MTRNEAPRVAVIGLGGTIAMTRSEPGAGATPALEADELLRSIPGLAESDVTITAHTFRSVPSPSLSLTELDELATFIDTLAEADTDGVVITQGTDTMEESAFYLDITVNTDIPLVMTGAMRNPSLAGADGPANLLAAITVAADRAAAGLGCVVVMADEIHTARHVRKTHSTSLAAFTSPDTGPIGHIVEGEPHFLVQPGQRVVLERSASGHQPVVPIATTAMGDDLSLLRPLRTDVDGLVVAGFGVGHVPGAAAELLAEYAARMPVVLATRSGAGAVHKASYGYRGSEQDMQQRGLINAGFLDPQKARILLVTLLARAAEPGEITRAFNAISR